MKKIFNKEKIKIRQLSVSDLKRTNDFKKYIDALVFEDAKILMNQKTTLKKEKQWIKREIKNIEQRKSIVLVAKNKNNEIVGISDIGLEYGRKQHIGELGISIKKNYRGIGLGEFLMKEIIKLAKINLKPKPRVIRLSVFASNSPAINLYKKFGFKKVALIPKMFNYKNKFQDEIVMIFYL